MAAATAAAAAVGKISAVTTRRLCPKWENLAGDGGEGKKAGHWKEEKTEADQVSREVKSLARRRPTHVIPSCRGAAHPCVRDAEWAELHRKEMA